MRHHGGNALTTEVCVQTTDRVEGRVILARLHATFDAALYRRERRALDVLAAAVRAALVRAPRDGPVGGGAHRLVTENRKNFGKK